MSAKLLAPIMRKISSSTTSMERNGGDRNDGNSTSQANADNGASPCITANSRLPSTSSVSAAAKDRYQLVFMGAGGVGKSALISRFLYDKFPARYKPTVEDMYVTEFPIGDDLFTLELLDTSGTMRFPAMQALNMARGDGFVLVYSVADPESFEEVKQLREEILAAKAENSEDPVPIVVVGNKADCPPNERKLPTITAETIATIDWEHGFVETSALKGDNVLEVFRELIKQSQLNVDIVDMFVEKRRKSFPVSLGTPKRKDFQRKRGSCVIN